MITKLRKRILEVYGPNNQNRLAHDAHINQAIVSQYATGLKPISAKHISVLCQLLECQPYDIVGYVEMNRVSSNGH